MGLGQRSRPANRKLDHVIRVKGAANAKDLRLIADHQVSALIRTVHVAERWKVPHHCHSGMPADENRKPTLTGGMTPRPLGQGVALVRL